MKTGLFAFALCLFVAGAMSQPGRTRDRPDEFDPEFKGPHGGRAHFPEKRIIHSNGPVKIIPNGPVRGSKPGRPQPYNAAKGADKWTVAQVNIWLERSTGDSPAYHNDLAQFRINRVDGPTLLKLTAKDLEKYLKIENKVHRIVLMNKIDNLRAKIDAKPNDLDEYYAANRHSTPFFILTLLGCPRLAIVTAYMLDTKDVVHALVDGETGAKFWLTVLVCPHGLVGYYAMGFWSRHPYLVFFFALQAVLGTATEIVLLTKKKVDGAKHVAIVGGLFAAVAAGYWAVWPVVPFWVCNFLFHAMITVSPLVVVGLFGSSLYGPTLTSLASVRECFSGLSWANLRKLTKSKTESSLASGMKGFGSGSKAPLGNIY